MPGRQELHTVNCLAMNANGKLYTYRSVFPVCFAITVIWIGQLSAFISLFAINADLFYKFKVNTTYLIFHIDMLGY